MVELTINKLIKIGIAVAVLVVVIVGISFAFKSYVIPYFSGIGFEEPKIDISSQFGKELIQEKNKIGIVEDDGKYGYFVYKDKETGDDKKTDIYFTKKGEIYLQKSRAGFDYLAIDDKIGYLDKDGKIIIEKEVEYKDILNGAYKYGLEIYKIGGDENKET